MKRLLTIAVLAATTATVHAEPETVRVETDWYGSSILAADAGVFALSAVTRQPAISLGWVGTGALVHASHGHGGRAGVSLGLRVALPILGFALGASSAKGCSGDLCDLGPALAGGLVGMGAAEVTDLVMATDEHEIHVQQRSFMPVATVRREGGATVGFAARF